VHLRKIIEFSLIQHSVIGLYNGAGKCSLGRITWDFKYNELRLVLQGLKLLP